MTSELQLLVQKLCRVCGGAVSQFQTSTKFELKDALLNCMKIDIRTDQARIIYSSPPSRHQPNTLFRQVYRVVSVRRVPIS